MSELENFFLEFGAVLVFTLPEDDPLKKVVFLDTDSNGTLLFVSLQDNLPKLMTKIQFEYLYKVKLKEKLSLSKKEWIKLAQLRESETFTNELERLKRKSERYRLWDIYDSLTFTEKYKVLFYAESHCDLNSVLSKEESTLLKNYGELDVFQRDAILSQVKALAKMNKKEVIKK